MSPFDPATIPSSGPFSTATKTITAAQIKALAGTPISLVAAPGAGHVISVLSVVTYFTYVAPAYVDPGTADPGLEYGPTGYVLYDFPIAIFTNTASNMWSWGPPYSGFTPLTSSPASEPISNLPVLLGNFGANLTTGNGTLKVRLYYEVLATA